MTTRQLTLSKPLYEKLSELIINWSTAKGDLNFRTFFAALTIQEKDMLGFQAFRDKFRIFTKYGDFEIHKADVSE
jgi:hypothetical protein